ncbi:MORN repeat-containing protein 5 [Plasmodiophora brassicae]
MAPLSQEDRDRILSALDAPDSIEGGSSVLKFDNGVAYDGELSNGRFHGTGTIVFPEGTVEAVWAHGVASDPVVTFHDGLRFHDDVSWDYCTEDDQRFQSEITDPLLLQDPVRLRNDGGPAAIPQGTYDIGTGFLDIGKDAVFTYDVRRCPIPFVNGN